AANRASGMDGVAEFDVVRPHSGESRQLHRRDDRIPRRVGTVRRISPADEPINAGKGARYFCESGW
ncbi:MAG: hypothetical protein Q4D27_06480, partial [Coriobacteriia bacterium]|nr:hypothetical protein [Coriobacteriia bacterium]